MKKSNNNNSNQFEMKYGIVLFIEEQRIDRTYNITTTNSWHITQYSDKQIRRNDIL